MSVTFSITGGLVHLSGNPIGIVVTADAPRPNHRLAVKVTCPQLVSPEQCEEIEPIGLVAHFNIQGLVDEPLKTVFEYPPVGKVCAREALALMVTIDAGEVWDDLNGDRQEAWMGAGQMIRVLNGKLRAHELALLQDKGESFASRYISGGMFLSSLPQDTVVAPNQLIKLWYLSRWTENHSCELNFLVQTNLKTGHLPITEPVTLFASGLFEFSFHPEFAGFITEPGELVEAYWFWLSDENGDISERRYFLVDNGYYEKPLFGFFRNRFSAIDPIWLRGALQEGCKTEVETAFVPLRSGAGTQEGSVTTVTATGQRYWEVNTGAMVRGAALSLREFLEARERWIVDPDNPQVLIPVFIEGGDFLLFDSMEDIQNLSLKLLEAHV